jgi:CRISPR-associated protein Csd2
MTPIKNRYSIIMAVDCLGGNPNGDPDADNMPRTEPDGHGLISSQAVKRVTRDTWQQTGNPIIQIRGSIIQKEVAKMIGDYKAKKGKNPPQEVLDELRDKSCKGYLDVRSFGQVFTEGVQIRGAVQIDNLRSVHPIDIQTQCLTRCWGTDSSAKGKTAEEIGDMQNEGESGKSQTMGRKHHITYGLYMGMAYVIPANADLTGFSEEDLGTLREAFHYGYENLRSSSKGQMTLHSDKSFVFRHVGEDEKQGRLGVMKDSDIRSIVMSKVTLKDGVDVPKSINDYNFPTLEELQAIFRPKGIEVETVF